MIVGCSPPWFQGSSLSIKGQNEEREQKNRWSSVLVYREYTEVRSLWTKFRKETNIMWCRIDSLWSRQNSIPSLRRHTSFVCEGLQIWNSKDGDVRTFFLRVKAETELKHYLSIRALVRKLGLHGRQGLGIKVVLVKESKRFGSGFQHLRPNIGLCQEKYSKKRHDFTLVGQHKISICTPVKVFESVTLWLSRTLRVLIWLCRCTIAAAAAEDSLRSAPRMALRQILFMEQHGCGKEGNNQEEIEENLHHIARDEGE